MAGEVSAPEVPVLLDFVRARFGNLRRDRRHAGAAGLVGALGGKPSVANAQDTHAPQKSPGGYYPVVVP